MVSEKSLGFGKFGLGRKVSVSVSNKFGLGKKYPVWFKKKSRFRKIRSRKKGSVLVSENVVSEKSLGFGKFGIGKEKIKILYRVNSAHLFFEF